MKPLVTIAALFCVLLAVGCKNDASSDSSTQPAGDQTVHVLIFSEYIPQDVIDDFKKETGIEAKVANFASNEELLGKLRGRTSEFDVVSPSDYMIRRLARLNLVQKLDRSQLPHFTNLDPELTGKSFDPQNEFSVPLFWGTTGIGYNKKKVAGPVDSWAVLFDPKYKGQILMLNDPRELLAAALRKEGKNPNTKDPAELAAAVETLKARKDLVKVYDSDGFFEKLATGDVALAQGYNGQFAKVISEKPDKLQYVIPKEGATLWVDNLAIPAGSNRVANAHRFINFLMRPDIAARTANYAAYATPNKAARESIDQSLLNDPVIYPPADVMKRLTPMEDLGDSNKIVDRVMTEIKS